MPGVSFGFAKAKIPGTDEVPPPRLESESFWPKVIALAIGFEVMVGDGLLTVTLMSVGTEL